MSEQPNTLTRVNDNLEEMKNQNSTMNGTMAEGMATLSDKAVEENELLSSMGDKADAENSLLTSIDAKATTRNTSLASVDSKLSTTNTSLSSLNSKSDTGNASLTSLDSKIPVLANGKVPVDGSGVDLTTKLKDGAGNSISSSTGALDVNSAGSFTNLTSNGTTQVKTGAGILVGVAFNTFGLLGNIVTLYDDVAGTSNKIGVIDTVTITSRFIVYNLKFQNGLKVVSSLGTAADLTFIYR